MTYSIGILDNMRSVNEQPPQEVLEESIALARYAEQLGYHRYWFGEHRSPETVSSTPEIMIPIIAANTQKIRVGSGGIMLTHYSPLKVAEVFSTLAILFPQRIDLGVGSAPGSSVEVARELQEGMVGANLSYKEKVRKLLNIIDEESIDVNVWLLGKGSSNSILASQLGTSFAFGDPAADSQILEQYRASFKLSKRQSHPRDLLAIMAICAETEEKAEELARDFSYQVDAKNTTTGDTPAYLSPALKAYSNLKDEWSSASLFPNVVVGDPTTVRSRLELLGEFFNIKEFMLSTIPTSNFEDRRRSYELIAEAFNLNQI